MRKTALLVILVGAVVLCGCDKDEMEDTTSFINATVKVGNNILHNANEALENLKENEDFKNLIGETKEKIKETVNNIGDLITEDSE